MLSNQLAVCLVIRKLPRCSRGDKVFGYHGAFTTRCDGLRPGYEAAAAAVSAAIGPTLAAGILATATWPYLFAVNIPFGIAALVIGIRALPYTPRGRHAFDWQSALLSAIMFGLGIAAIDSVGHGEPPLFYLSEAVVAAIACILLVRRQLTATSPVLPIDLLRIPIFTLSICTSIASFSAQMLALVALPFYLSDRFAYSAVEIGLLITPCQSRSP